jgi:hypothetical protein
LPTDPIHARAFVLFNSAMLTRGELRVWVQCQTPVAGGSTILVVCPFSFLS